MILMFRYYGMPWLSVNFSIRYIADLIIPETIKNDLGGVSCLYFSYSAFIAVLSLRKGGTVALPSSLKNPSFSSNTRPISM